MTAQELWAHLMGSCECGEEVALLVLVAVRAFGLDAVRSFVPEAAPVTTFTNYGGGAF